MLSTLKSPAAEKREFMRQLEREKKRATYLKAAKASAGRPQDVLRAKAAAERRLQNVAALQTTHQPPISSSPKTSADDGAGFFSTARATSPGTS